MPGTKESQEGNERYRYAKITVPPLAAGELRVFSTDGTPVVPTDAVLCQGSSVRASYKTTYNATHRREERAARTARDDAEDADDAVMTALTEAQKEATAAADARTDLTGTQLTNALRSIETRVRSDLSTAATRLRTAATNLETAARALETAGDGTRGTADAPGEGNAGIAQTNANTARMEATEADEARKDKSTTDAPSADDDDPDDEIEALYKTAPIADDDNPDPNSAAAALAQAATDLRTAAEHLEAAATAEQAHDGFELRAEVKSSDRELILVTVQSAPETAVENQLTAGPTLALAIPRRALHYTPQRADSQRGRLPIPCAEYGHGPRPADGDGNRVREYPRVCCKGR